jgi:Tol biopolymer transport system component
MRENRGFALEERSRVLWNNPTDGGVRVDLEGSRKFPVLRWATRPLATGTVFAVLLVAMSLGIRVPPVGLLALFPGASALDYSGGPFHRFAPLKSDFIRSVLGEVITAGDAIRADRAVAAPGHGAVPAQRNEGQSTIPPLSNDDFEHAAPIDTIPFEAETETTGATRQAGEPDGCATVKDGGTVWFRYSAGMDGALSVDTFGSSYGTMLALYKGTRLDALERLACDEDARANAALGFVAGAGTTYYVQAGAALVTGGHLVLHLREQGARLALVALNDAGEQADDMSLWPSVSGDGRYVAFTSWADNLVPGYATDCIGANGPPWSLCANIYVRDLLTNTTEIVSVAPDGRPGNADSFYPSISDDGRFVAFESLASNLAPGDDRRCVQPLDPGNSASTESSALSCSDVFVHDRLTHRTELVSASLDGGPANGQSRLPSISGDGRFVAFDSLASDLVEGDTNVCYTMVYAAAAWPPAAQCRDVFVRDRATGTTTRVSVSSSGAQAETGSGSPAISSDGRFVAFGSSDVNLVPGAFPDEECGGLPTERYAFRFDSYAPCRQVFVHDRLTHETSIASVSDDSTPGNDDSFGSEHNPENHARFVSADGRFVAFYSGATNLAPDDGNATADIFVRDRIARTTRRVSVSSSGDEANGSSTVPSISADGRYVAFQSDAGNLVADDVEEFPDVFLHDIERGTTIRISVSSTGEGGHGISYGASVSSDGRFVAFASNATDLVEGDVQNCTATQDIVAIGSLLGCGHVLLFKPPAER